MKHERFWSKVDKNGLVPAHCPELGPCWVWTAAVTRGGYGNFRLPGTRKNVRANRYAFFLTNEHFPVNALHHCDNPPCCNPSHIYDGSSKDNTRDMVIRGRAKNGGLAADAHGRAKLRNTDIASIVELRKSGMLLTEIASRYGVVYQTIQRVLEGKNWKSVKRDSMCDLNGLVQIATPDTGSAVE